MEKITVVVLFLGILIFFSHLFSKMFNKTKIPNVLLLMLIGIVAGFFVDKDIFFGEVGRVFTTITLVIILFESGTSLKFRELKSTLGSATMVTFFNFVVTIVIVVLILSFFTDLDIISSIFLGATLGGTSSAVVIPMVKQLRMGQKSSTVLVLESALSDVLCLVVGLAALDGMQAGAINVAGMFNSMWKSFLFAAMFGVVGGIVWSLILNWIRGLENSMFTTLAFLFILYGGVELMGFNGGIAALCFGIILGNSESIGETKLWKKAFKFKIASLNDSEKQFFSEIVFVLQTYFFVYIGVVLEFGNLNTYLIALLIVLFILLIRPLSIRFFARKGTTPKEITIMSIMSPKGLVAAVLASLPLQLGLFRGQEVAEFGYAVVLLSIVICSGLIIIVSKDPLIFNKMLRRKKKKMSAGISLSNEQVGNNTEIREFLNEEYVVEDIIEPEKENNSITNNKKYIDEFDDED